MAEKNPFAHIKNFKYISYFDSNVIKICFIMFEIFGLNFVISDLDVWFNSLLFLYLLLIATVDNKYTLQIYMYPDGKGVSLGALAKL